MLCTDLVRCHELSYCQQAGSVLNIGELVDTPYPGTVRVKFTDLATDRITVIDNSEALPYVGIDTEDFTPLEGHSYQIEVVLSPESGAIIPVPFKPYVMNGNDIEVSTTSYLLATARFVKVFQLDGDIESPQEQWLVSKS